mgnify:CR=1 FL=1
MEYHPTNKIKCEHKNLVNLRKLIKMLELPKLKQKCFIKVSNIYLQVGYWNFILLSSHLISHMIVHMIF